MRIKFYIFILSFLLPLSVYSSDPVETKAIDKENFDLTVSPSVDFYEYVNGGWLKKFEIPAGYSRWSSFHEVNENNNIVLKEILDEVYGKTFPKGSNEQLIADLYSTFMDSVSIDNNGLNDISGLLSLVDNLNSKSDFAKLFAKLNYLNIPVHVFAFSGQDIKNSSDVILQIGNGGIGLPERDYYLSEDEYYKKIQDQYKQYLSSLLKYIVKDESKIPDLVEKIYALEKRFAAVTFKNTEFRDFNKTYNKSTKSEISSKFKNFNFDEFIKELKISDEDLVNGINVIQPKYIEEFDNSIGDTDLDLWKNYLKVMILNQYADYINSDLEDLKFNFYSTQLSGVKEKQPRWKRGLNLINSNVGEAIGQIFVQKTFSPVAKQKCIDMINDLISSFRVRLNNLEWMSAETKAEAFKKLDKLSMKIGYPDKWQGYEGLSIDNKSLLQNLFTIREFFTKRNLNRINKPVDKTRWLMNPHTVNAYFSSTNNEIVFPAGILQPPFFSEKYDDAVNYGGIGGVIGHEIIHGYDDNGRKFDSEGNLKNWWTDEDMKKFDNLANMVVEQYDNYVEIDTFRINGELTLGENIADLGGLTIAYYALKEKLKNRSASEIDGFTPEQRFFISWAQIWRGKATPESAKLLLKTDVHAPGKFRVLGPVSNMKEFQEAFNIKDSDPIMRSIDKRIIIW